jgi:NAD(P)-dependent dehydrogenase (short-subunit alcohol dehydrogenase family)
MSTQVVLIIGGLTGIGRAAAVAFARKGAKVVVAGRRDEAGKALAKELRSFGSEAEFIHADVLKEDDVRALVNQTVARFGRLDVTVNNAAGGGFGMGRADSSHATAIPTPAPGGHDHPRSRTPSMRSIFRISVRRLTYRSGPYEPAAWNAQVWGPRNLSVCGACNLQGATCARRTRL